MTTEISGVIKGLNAVSARLAKFGKIANVALGKSPALSFLTGGIIAARGIKQLGGWGQAVREAAQDARVLGRHGLLDMSNGMRIASNLAGDMAPAIKRIAGGLAMMGIATVRAGVGLTKMGLNLAIKGMLGFVGAVRSAVNQLGMFAAGAAGVAAFALWHVAKGAMALGEQTDRARIIFGDATKDIVAQSNLMATAFGVSRKEYIASASAFGTIFQGVGYDEAAAAKLSNHFVKLGTDLSSLAHIPVAEALEKLQSGLAGQVRPLREVGVMMSEEAIKTYAATHGIAALGTEMSDQQKVMARIGFLTDHLAKAHGNLALTADSTANVVRSLAGRFQNLSDTAGTALNTILGPAIGELTVGIQALQMAWDSSALAASSASVGVVGAAQGQTKAIGMVQQAIGFVADAWQTVKLTFDWVQLKITEGLIFTLKNMDKFSGALGAITKALEILGVVSKGFTETWLEDLKRMQAEQMKTFGKNLAAAPASEGINKVFEDARRQIENARKELAKPGPSIAGLKPKAEDVSKHKEVKFASAMARGSQEAASTILRSRFGGGKTNDELKKQTSLQTKIATGIDKIAGAVTGGGAFAVMETL